MTWSGTGTYKLASKTRFKRVFSCGVYLNGVSFKIESRAC
nr:MAG TPA: hypothetical protein [Caudoviricetes sp.]